MWARNKTIVFLFAAAMSQFAVARPPVCHFAHPIPPKLNLKDAVTLSVRNNPQVQIANLQRIVDKYQVLVAQYDFEPVYKLQINGRYTRRSIPVYDSTVGVSLKLPIGTEISVDVNSEFGMGQRDNVTYQIRQPLLRGFGCDVNLASLRNTIDGDKINELTLKETVMVTITSVIQAYNQIIQDERALEINRLSLKDALETLKSTQLQIKAGRRAGTSITQQQTQVAQLQLLITRGENAVKQSKRALLVLLGVDPNAPIKIDTAFKMSQVRIPSQSDSIRMALQFNTAYQSAVIGLRQRYRDVVVQANNQLPDLSVVASGTKDLRIADSTINDDRVVVSLDVPIAQTPRRAGYVDAKVGYDQFKISLENIQRELINSVMNGLNDLEAQKKQIKIAEDSVKYARQSLEIEQQKYKYGRSSIFEITQLRQTLTVNEQTLLNEQITFLNTYAEFQRLLGITLESWNVRVVF